MSQHASSNTGRNAHVITPVNQAKRVFIAECDYTMSHGACVRVSVRVTAIKGKSIAHIKTGFS